MQEFVHGTYQWWRPVPGNLQASEFAHLLPLEYLGKDPEVIGLFTLPISKITLKS